jgi:hypothetical protein
VKQLIRRCPMCKGVMGIVITESVREHIRPVLGLCMECGYAIKWALIRS